MDKVLYLNSLYDVYKDLLTEKQQMYFESYYFENLSLGEIADNLDISRNAVHKQLKLIEEKLEEYEKSLKIVEKNNKLKKIIDKIEDEKIKKEIERII